MAILLSLSQSDVYLLIFLFVTFMLLSSTLTYAFLQKGGEEGFLSRQVHKPTFTRVSHPQFGRVYVIDQKDMISRTIMHNNEWEPELNAIMASHYKPGTDILDIGANMGFSSLGINSRVPITGTVHAFEPQYRLCTLLSYNLHRLPKSKIYNCAVSDKTSLISYVVNDDNVGATPVIRREASHDVYVPTIRLDDHIDLFKTKISLVKIDVEGHELQVLKGSKRLIQKYLPTLEIDIYGSIDGVVEFLKPMGYELIWNKNADYFFENKK